MENKCKILIVEDEVLIAKFIEKMLQKEGFSNLEIANDIQTAETKFSTFRPDIILMDINLERPNTGIELAAKKNKEAKIIFLTAQNDLQTITKALQTKPESYLTKPIKIPDLLASINLCQIKNLNKSITIRNGYNDEIVDFEDILYIISEKNYIDIFTIQHKYTIRKSLYQFLEELPSNFIQIHRSIVVNKNHIQKKSATKVFINNKELSISRNCTFDL